MPKLIHQNEKNGHFGEKSAHLRIFRQIFGHFELKNALLGCFSIFCHLNLTGQAIIPVSDIEFAIRTLIEDFTEFNDGNAEFDFNTLYEDLVRLHSNKLDLNKVSLEELGILFFLTNNEIQNIIDYRTNYGEFLSIYELQTVPGLSFEKIETLLLFVRVDGGDQKFSDYTISQLESSNDQLYLKWKFQMETALGFMGESGLPPKFAGDKNHYYLRYNHSARNHRYGLLIEKDPGEKIINSNSETGLDYLSFHYQVEQPTGWLQQLNLGDYSINLGQGLIAHSSFGLGKSSFTTTVKKSRPGIQAYNSVSENLGLRGVALDIRPRHTSFSTLLFAAHSPRDANLTGVDVDGFDTFSSFPGSGLHRTTGEIRDHDAVYETTLGTSLRYRQSNQLSINLNAISQQYNKRFTPSSRPYQLYRWNGDDLSNISLDYNVLRSGWNVFGEVARSSNDGWAQIHGFIKTFDPTFDLAMVYRKYEPGYQSIYSNVFGESATANNEEGLYLGFEYRPSRNWTIKGYVDHWKNDWLRFRVDGPSRGREYLIRINYFQKRKRNLYLQYRYETKEENSDTDLIQDIPVSKFTHRLRLHASHQPEGGVELRTRAEMSLFKKEEITERGFLFYQDLIYRKIDSPLSISTRMSYFDISDFDARIYAYENDLLFEYYIPSFSGRGMRYYVHSRYNISRKLMAEIRWEQTHFFDVTTIRSGDNLIDGNTLSRMKAQIRYSF